MNKYPTSWFGGGNETPCGGGSKVINMQNAIREVPRIIRDFEIKSVMELGCGDLNFAKNAVFPSGVSYVGADIQRRDTWDSFPNLELIEANAEEMTGFAADMVICRDFFIHLPTTAALGIMKKIKAKWLLATSYDKAANAKRMDRPSAGFHAIDMTAPPFSLGKPERRIEEYVKGKYLGLWRMK